MAKARATCTCATCGKVFEVTTIRQNTREASSFEKWAEANITECRDCEAKRIAEKRAEESAQAAENANERGWPELQGTEKQVAWANTLREQELAEYIERAKALQRNESRRAKGELIIAAIEYTIKTKVKASWWIDNRGLVKDYVTKVFADMKQYPEKYAGMEAAEAAKAEVMNDQNIIAQPENRTHDGIVDIRVSDARVAAEYAKDEDFRKLVKGIGYAWNRELGAWTLNIGVKTGTAIERAAELGNKLLNAGFSIRIQDADTLRKAINGDYEPMTYRWVAATLDGRFKITWAKDDSFYDQARKLPGARYVSPGIEVPVKEYEAVLDFAHTYDFRLTPGATELMKKMSASVLVVAPAKANQATYDEHPIADILNTPAGILDDLKD